jgi:glutathione transport system permease protein
MHMKYVVQRVGYALLVMWLASIVTFAGLRVAPGNVTSGIYNPTTTPPAVMKAFEKSLGLDDPLIVQYWRYLRGLLTGHLGTSLVDRLPVTTVVAHSAGYTLILALLAFVVSFGIGVPAGVLAAIHRGSILDRIVRTFASLLLAVPNFVLALLLVLVVGVELGWLPVSGADSWRSVILPTIVLAAEPCALTMRITRTAFLGQAGAEYSQTLRARGLRDRRINWRHVLRNALNSILSLGAVQVRTLLGYTLIVEVIFRWPGLGYQLVESILHRDYPVAEVLAILLAAVVVISSALGDIALRWADPRIRVSGEVA